MHDGIIKGYVETLNVLEEIEKRKAEPVLFIKEQEYPEADLDKEIDTYYGMYQKDGVTYAIENHEVCLDWKMGVNPAFIIDLARHFYELGLNARKEEII